MLAATMTADGGRPRIAGRALPVPALRLTPRSQKICEIIVDTIGRLRIACPRVVSVTAGEAPRDGQCAGGGGAGARIIGLERRWFHFVHGQGGHWSPRRSEGGTDDWAGVRSRCSVAIRDLLEISHDLPHNGVSLEAGWFASRCAFLEMDGAARLVSVFTLFALGARPRRSSYRLLFLCSEVPRAFRDRKLSKDTYSADSELDHLSATND